MSNQENKTNASETLPLRPRDFEISADQPFAQDALERQKLIEPLAELLENTPGPFVLSVSGPWGSGKTTFVKMLMQHMIRNDHACAYLSAWETDFAADPLPAIVSSLHEMSSAEDSESKLRKAGKLATIVARRGVPAVTKIATLGILDINEIYEAAIADAVSGSVGDVVDVFTVEKKAIELLREELSKFVETVSEVGNQRALVFLDDLDRCRPLYAIEVLERIKHVFNVTNLTFVISLDRKQIGISLGAVYGSKIDSDEYIRRFIDLDFALPTVHGPKFVNSLCDRFDLAPIFTERVHGQQREDRQNLVTTFSDFARLFDLRLRTQEQVFTRIVVALRTTPTNVPLHAVPIVMLSMLREVRFSLYSSYLAGKCSPFTIIGEIKAQPEGRWFLDTFAGLVTVAFLVKNTPDQAEKNRAFEYLQMAIAGDEGALEKFGVDAARIRDIHPMYKQRIVPDVPLSFFAGKIDLASKFS